MSFTDKEFWAEYWNSKDNLITNISPNYLFSDLFAKLYKNNKITNAIEIGGFPGFFSIYLAKYYNTNVSLVDLIVIPEIIRKLEHKNGIANISLQAFEADIYHFNPTEKFDLVHSHGFIEHFEQIEEIVDKHIQLLSNNGSLLITLPNFKGFNGWIQRKFNPQLYKSHNIACMDKTYLRSVLGKLNLNNIEVSYYLSFGIWLDNIENKSPLFRVCFKTIWLFGKIFFKLVPIKTKLFSPYISILAKKN